MIIYIEKKKVTASVNEKKKKEEKLFKCDGM